MDFVQTSGEILRVIPPEGDRSWVAVVIVIIIHKDSETSAIDEVLGDQVVQKGGDSVTEPVAGNADDSIELFVLLSPAFVHENQGLLHRSHNIVNEIAFNVSSAEIFVDGFFGSHTGGTFVTVEGVGLHTTVAVFGVDIDVGRS